MGVMPQFQPAAQLGPALREQMESSCLFHEPSMPLWKLIWPRAEAMLGVFFIRFLVGFQSCRFIVTVVVVFCLCREVAAVHRFEFLVKISVK